MKLSKPSPFFYKIYNVSAIKMHKMATKIGGIVRGIFTDTIFIESKINKPKWNKNVIDGIRETAIKDFSKCIILHQEHLNILMNALNQLNLNKLEFKKRGFK